MELHVNWQCFISRFSQQHLCISESTEVSEKDRFCLTVAFYLALAFILPLFTNINFPKRFLFFPPPIKTHANQEMRHFCCNILGKLPALLTLFYFNLLSHTVDLGKLEVMVQLLL